MADGTHLPVCAINTHYRPKTAPIPRPNPLPAISSLHTTFPIFAFHLHAKPLFRHILRRFCRKPFRPIGTSAHLPHQREHPILRDLLATLGYKPADFARKSRKISIKTRVRPRPNPPNAAEPAHQANPSLSAWVTRNPFFPKACTPYGIPLWPNLRSAARKPVHLVTKQSPQPADPFGETPRRKQHKTGPNLRNGAVAGHSAARRHVRVLKCGQAESRVNKVSRKITFAS